MLEGGGVGRTVVDTVTIESIPILLEREEDGRWWAGIKSMPGVMAYCPARDAAIGAVRALALRAAGGCIEDAEEAPQPFACSI